MSDVGTVNFASGRPERAQAATAGGTSRPVLSAHFRPKPAKIRPQKPASTTFTYQGQSGPIKANQG
jgi:hypothetical protein